MRLAFWNRPRTWTVGERVLAAPALEKRIKDAVRQFRVLMVDRGCTDDTTYGYGNSLGAVMRRLGRTNISLTQMRDYLVWMRENNYSYSHQLNTSLAYEAYSLMRGTEVRFGRQPKPKRVLKDLLSEAEISRIIQAAHTVRLKAMVALLAYSGVRSGEFVRIKVKNFDAGTNQVYIEQGKNKKDRYVHIPAECTRLIVAYLRSTQLAGGDPLFTTVVRGAPLVPWDLRKIVRVLRAKANIEQRVHPHLFRHSLASILLNRGASLHLIKTQLGHEYYESTLIYAQSMPERQRTEYEMFKPVYV